MTRLTESWSLLMSADDDGRSESSKVGAEAAAIRQCFGVLKVGV